MVNGCSGMESEENKKKLNDDLVVFMRKRSETDAPQYTARLKTYVDFKQKRRRAAAARRHTEYRNNQDGSASKKKNTAEINEKSVDSAQPPAADVNKRRNGEKYNHKPHSLTRSHSAEPVDACCRRRRRACRRRRRSCRRRSRRRRRRSCGRRRRRSCSRRRRRRSCRRRRRRRRRCRR
ncbi:protamine-2-like [Vanessa cardui]|uniref:protamine-2-like n=1 Tax=Vanessa cardui TaxID=171605 RepID=UPI001F131D6F|nr:protamine-2-like [Vanessa cardui]